MSYFKTVSKVVFAATLIAASVIPFEASSAQPVPYCAGIGSDFSASPATVPIATYVLLITVPVACGRNAVEVQNQSAGTIQVVRDDGNGNNQTSILLAGVAANQQGAGWSSTTFKGRIRVYGVAGSQVEAFQE